MTHIPWLWVWLRKKSEKDWKHRIGDQFNSCLVIARHWVFVTKIWTCCHAARNLTRTSFTVISPLTFLWCFQAHRWSSAYSFVYSEVFHIPVWWLSCQFDWIEQYLGNCYSTPLRVLATIFLLTSRAWTLRPNEWISPRID